jgi:CheY-like chemotaxis protein
MEPEKAILLVEDNEDDVFFAQLALKDAGVQNPLHVVTDGKEALRYLSGMGQFADREKFPFPSLILLDLKLPYRSGLDILAWMRQKNELPETFVAVLTSSNEPKDLKAAHDLGAKTYVVKPPTPQLIYNLVRTFKLAWLACNATHDGDSPNNARDRVDSIVARQPTATRPLPCQRPSMTRRNRKG